jgi:tetratricopeptide (TPR) repeat protein
MRRSIAGLLLVVLATGALETRRAAGQAISFRQFSDWYFAYCAGQRALARGDLDVASRRYREAIKLAWPGAMSDPRPLARTYTDFAQVLLLQGRPDEAEPLAQWALQVREERFGKRSPQAAATLHVLAQLATAQVQYSRAENLLTRAIAIWEHELGSDHFQLVIGLTDLATLYRLDRKYPEAEALFERVLDMPGTVLPPSHPYRALGLIGLATAFAAQGQFDRADSTDLMLRNVLGRMSPTTYQAIAPSLDDYLTQLRKLGRTSQAEALQSSARAARRGDNDLVHPNPAEPRRRPPPIPRPT